jgi:hypothetical protein
MTATEPIDTIAAMSYLELISINMGLGCCWASVVFDGNQGMETLIFIFRSSCRTPGARSYDGGVGVME